MRKDYVARAAVLASVFATMWLPTAPAEAISPFRQQVLTIANRQLGVPYVYGGTSRTGFDCSGLVQYVFNKVGVTLPRTADRQYRMGSPVLFKQAKPGDLMFFNTGSRPKEVTHVGIYMGESRMVHAPSSGKQVRYAQVGARSWFRPRLLGIRRVNRATFELTRKPKGWELEAMPRGVMFTIVGDGSPIDRLALGRGFWAN